MPPGPPVLQTLVAEVYGPTAEGPRPLAAPDPRHLRRTPTASSTSTGTSKTTSPSSIWRRRPREGRAQRHLDRRARSPTPSMSPSPAMCAGLLHVEAAKEDVPIMVRLDRATRTDLERLRSAEASWRRAGNLVALSELVRVETGTDRQEHLSQEPDARHLRHRRRRRRDGKPRLRHSQARPEDRQARNRRTAMRSSNSPPTSPSTTPSTP